MHSDEGPDDGGSGGVGQGITSGINPHPATADGGTGGAKERRDNMSDVVEKTDKEKYCSLLDVLSETRIVKDSLRVAADSISEAIVSVGLAEKLIVELVLTGRKLVAHSEEPRTDKT